MSIMASRLKGSKNVTQRYNNPLLPKKANSAYYLGIDQFNESTWNHQLLSVSEKILKQCLRERCEKTPLGLLSQVHHKINEQQINIGLHQPYMTSDIFIAIFYLFTHHFTVNSLVGITYLRFSTYLLPGGTVKRQLMRSTSDGIFVGQGQHRHGVSIDGTRFPPLQTHTSKVYSQQQDHILY